MSISTKARYALRLMVRLARLPSGASATVPELALIEDISPDYAAQIMMSLRRSGLVASRRGVGGGITLAKAPDAVTVADIVEAAEGPIRVVDCRAGGETCRRASVCVTRDVWEGATNLLVSYFRGITLRMLVERAKARETDKTDTTFEI